MGHHSNLFRRKSVWIFLGLIWVGIFLIGCTALLVGEEEQTVRPSEVSDPTQPALGILPAAGAVYSAQTYCTVNGEDLIFDIHYPQDLGSGPFPLVVYVHGGAWTIGDRRGGAGSVFKAALLEAGYAYAAINYRLAPTNIFPAQIEDVKCAIRYFRANAESLGIDSDRIAALGGSAGGHLVALLGLTANQDLWEDVGGYTGVSSDVAAVVDLFGPADLRGLADPRYQDAYEDVFGEAVLSEDSMWVYSPLAYVSGEAPPFLIMHGDADGTVLLSQSVDLHVALADAGVPVELIVVRGGGHSNALFAEGASPSLGELTDILLEFLGMYLSLK